MAIIYGTTGNDNLIGTAGNDTIYGWARGGNANSVSGNDTLSGLAGDDQLFGGTGNDSLRLTSQLSFPVTSCFCDAARERNSDTRFWAL